MNDIIANGNDYSKVIGSLVENPKIPSGSDRDLVVYIEETKDTPFYFLTYNFNPSELITVNDFANNFINETHSYQITNISCLPDTSYDINVLSFLCSYRPSYFCLC